MTTDETWADHPEEETMKSVEPVKATDETIAATDVASETPTAPPKPPPSANGTAKPKRVRAKPAPKVASKVKVASEPKAKPAPKVKATKQAQAAKQRKAAAAAVQRKRNPAKLDRFGFRLGSIKSEAAAIYAKGNGATLAEVKAAIKSVQFNLLTELEAKGFEVKRTEVTGPTGRVATRYKLVAKG